MAAVPEDAIHPNLVQNLEHTHSLDYLRPFGQHYHGCNSPSYRWLKYADYAIIVVAGFGADLGAENSLISSVVLSGFPLVQQL